MKHPYLKTLLLCLCLFASINAFAEAVKIDGIYYNLITKAKQAEVTRNPSRYTGAVNIPETVSYNDVTYSVTSIGERAFFDCYRLTSVTIPNSVTSIGSNAFHGCSGLTSITIPNSVTSIGERAFFKCSSLTSVTIPNSVTSIGGGAFEGCSGLTSVTIGNSVKSIDRYAFSGCSGLTSITIPNSVTRIGGGAFQDCSGLTSVNIGNGVKYIYEQAFANCAELIDVYCYAENVPSTESDAFAESYIEYATLHVPAASIEQYKTASPWINFGTIVPLTDEDAVAEVQAVPVLIQTQGNTINVQGAEAGTEIILYGANGVQLDSVIATTGVASLNASRLSGSVAIVKIGNKTVKVLMKQ